MEPTPFSTSFTVAFGDADPAGVLYYPRFFHYCHRAFEFFFKARFRCDYHSLMTEDQIGFPTVSTRARYQKPFAYGESMHMRISRESINPRSVTLHYLAAGDEQFQDQRMEASVTTPAIDLNQFKSIALSGELQALFMTLSEFSAEDLKFARSL